MDNCHWTSGGIDISSVAQIVADRIVAMSVVEAPNCLGAGFVQVPRLDAKEGHTQEVRSTRPAPPPRSSSLTLVDGC